MDTDNLVDALLQEASRLEAEVAAKKTEARIELFWSAVLAVAAFGIAVAALVWSMTVVDHIVTPATTTTIPRTVSL